MSATSVDKVSLPVLIQWIPLFTQLQVVFQIQRCSCKDMFSPIVRRMRVQEDKNLSEQCECWYADPSDVFNKVVSLQFFMAQRKKTFESGVNSPASLLFLCLGSQFHVRIIQHQSSISRFYCSPEKAIRSDSLPVGTHQLLWQQE